MPRDALESLDSLEYLKERQEETGIFLDLDGTLSPLVDNPKEVEFAPATQETLQSLSMTFGAVVIVSGRSATTLQRIVRLPSLTYVGNHGLEVVEKGERRILLPGDVAQRMRDVSEALESAIDYDGVLLELKELSHAIHYRRASDPKETRRLLLDRLRSLDLEGTRITEGKLLIQIRPDYPLNKGTAVQTISSERGIRRILYAGDDTTDLDAFRAVSSERRRGRLAGSLVVVVHSDTPQELLKSADFAVAGVEEMQRLLRWLAS